MSGKAAPVAPTHAATLKPLEMLLAIGLVTPMGDPTEPTCTWGLPLHIQGPPGIGKSDRVSSAARSLGMGCGIIYPSTLQPEDISGALIPDGKGGATKVSMLSAVNDMLPHKRGLIFIDELTGARPAVQSGLLGFVLNRICGDVVLPPGIRIIAASNPPDSAAGGWDLEPPMANRFAHFTIDKPTADEWTAWLLSEQAERETSILDYEAMVKGNWGDAWPKVKGLFAGFMRAQASLLFGMPKEGSAERGRAWASPRTWHYAARAVATCEALNVEEDYQAEFVTACVGTGAAVQWDRWRRDADLPNPADVLKHGWQPDKRRLDRSVAVYTAMAAYITQKKNKEEKEMLAIKGWGLIKQACDAELKDLAMGPASSLVHAGLGMSNKNTKAAAQPILTGFGHSAIGRLVQEF